MFGFFKDKFNNLKETVANTASALVNNVVETISHEEEFSEFVLDDMEDLLEILLELHPEVDFENEEQLIDKGILDSFDIITIINTSMHIM